jgi:hypothetical protein
MVSVLASQFFSYIMARTSSFQCDDEVRFVLDQHAGVDFYSASSLKQSPWIDMSLHSGTLFWFRVNQSLLFLLNAVCLAEMRSLFWIPDWAFNV